MSGLFDSVCYLHERDERRDDHGHSAQVDARKLIAERLAAARGHHDQLVLSLLHNILDYLQLYPFFL